MTSTVATLLCVVCITLLFRLDRNGTGKVSKGLWIPIAWFFLCLSRPVSLWLGVSPTAGVNPNVEASLYIEGSPIDRAVLLVLEAAALVIVIGRWRRVSIILRNNWAFGLFFCYAALSISWSDYPFVTLKHWIKGVGDVMMILIVVTDQNPSSAIRRLMTRLAFVLLPLSILFIKYYPLLGRRLTLSWTMEPVGVATQKNGLGELCDVLGLGIVWMLHEAYNSQNDPYRKQRILALIVVLANIVWLLWMCNSMTSISALGMGTAVMLLSARTGIRRSIAGVHVLAAAVPALVAYALFFQSSGTLLQGLGRDPTLTGRTDAWRFVLAVPNNRLVGAGYESFWLGRHLETLWALLPGFRIQEAHNGYIEILVNMGWVGLIVLGIVIAAGYRNVIMCYRRNPDLGGFMLALFLATLITGYTEAAFRMMSPPWIGFLLATIAASIKTSSRGRGQLVLAGPQLRAPRSETRLIPVNATARRRLESVSGYLDMKGHLIWHKCGIFK